MAAGPPLLPSPPSPPAPRSPASAPSRLHAVAGASRDLAGEGDTGGANGGPPRTRWSCPRGGTQKPTRSARVAPEPRGPRVPAPARERTKFRGLPPTPLARPPAGSSWARPLSARGLPHVPPPLCSAGALTLAPGRNFARTATAHHARPPRRPGPAGGLVPTLPRAIVCARRTTAGLRGRRPLGPQPARVRARTAARGTPAPNGPTPPPSSIPPIRDRPDPGRPAPPRRRAVERTTGFLFPIRRRGGRTHRSSRHHLRQSPRHYYGPRPQAGSGGCGVAGPGPRSGAPRRDAGHRPPPPLGLAAGREVARRRRPGGSGGTFEGPCG